MFLTSNFNSVNGDIVLLGEHTSLSRSTALESPLPVSVNRLTWWRLEVDTVKMNSVGPVRVLIQQPFKDLVPFPETLQIVCTMENFINGLIV